MRPIFYGSFINEVTTGNDTHPNMVQHSAVTCSFVPLDDTAVELLQRQFRRDEGFLGPVAENLACDQMLLGNVKEPVAGFIATLPAAITYDVTNLTGDAAALWDALRPLRMTEPMPCQHQATDTFVFTCDMIGDEPMALQRGIIAEAAAVLQAAHPGVRIGFLEAQLREVVMAQMPTVLNNGTFEVTAAQAA